MSLNNPFNIRSERDFEQVALSVFKFQSKYNIPYHTFIKHLGICPSSVKSKEQIPFLPIEFFKSHQIVTGSNPVEKIFLSSGTTGQTQSRHYVTDLKVYEESFQKGFELFYGNIEEYTVLALLPAYLEREGSSLVYMADALIKASHKPKSGFYLQQNDS